MATPQSRIGHLHDDVILLRPESFRVLLSRANWGFCYLDLAGITKFKYERKNEKMDSGRDSKMTSSWNWPNRYSNGTKGLRSNLCPIPLSFCSFVRSSHTAIPLLRYMTGTLESKLVVCGETLQNGSESHLLERSQKLTPHLLLFPPREFCSRKVNLEFLQGMCCSLLAKAMITFPRLLKLLLILFVSRNRSPVEPELLKRSDPARSIRFRVPVN